MTFDELNEVRNIRAALEDAEKALEIWRRAEGMKIPTRNGLPKSHSVDSRIERVAIKIVDAENRIAELKEKLNDAIPRLEQKLWNEVKDTTAQTVMLLRYVEGMYFIDISLTMGYSQQHIYYLHNKALRSLKI